MNSNPHIEYDEDVLLLEETIDVRDLIVYNDDHNTFDHVIKTLVDVCGHQPEQAEQCTLLIHYKGQCTVKHGSYDELAGMCTAIHDRGISADVI
ncbi:ATP-dependent Clp protease adaptor ClpS [Hymenobacter aerophilus]|uniref:ATP-dependent Clp protease adaptor ClpS n=1 Tax=Hymenobacter aerophilus TaxID=119644 RepID=UPI000367DB1C|nr:ATP-dependent Clp protease adaptor ClpS [Hymenobacter aerophilus]